MAGGLVIGGSGLHTRTTLAQDGHRLVLRSTQQVGLGIGLGRRRGDELLGLELGQPPLALQLSSGGKLLQAPGRLQGAPRCAHRRTCGGRQPVGCAAGAVAPPGVGLLHPPGHHRLARRGEPLGLGEQLEQSGGTVTVETARLELVQGLAQQIVSRKYRGEHMFAF